MFQLNPTQQITNHPFRKAELIFSLYLQLTPCFIYHICISRGFFFPWCVILFYKYRYINITSQMCFHSQIRSDRRKKDCYLSSLCSRQILRIKGCPFFCLFTCMHKKGISRAILPCSLVAV